MVTFLSFHPGIIRQVADPEKRGRVKVEAPGIFGEGKKSWTGWIPFASPQAGSNNKGGGDEGCWIPPQVGQGVLVAFMAGDRLAPFCIPGPRFLVEPDGENQQMLPKEQKIAGKQNPRAATRVYVIKDEAGNTLLFDHRGKKEKVALVDWTGAGLSLVAGGKTEDEQEKEKEESKPRKGKRRGLRLVATGTSPKPSEITESGKAYLMLADLLGQGVISVAEDGRGRVAIYAATKNGEIGPSILLDAEKPAIYLTAGKTQLQVDGKAGHVAVTRGIIKEIEKPAPVEDAITGFRQAVQTAFEEFKEE
jgi:hypothetical protein